MTSHRLAYVMTQLLRLDLEPAERNWFIRERERLMDIEDEYRGEDVVETGEEVEDE